MLNEKQIDDEQRRIKVSVCVVTYNQEAYISECMQSIVDQITDFKIEILVADDGSTDKTRSIIKKFAEKYSCITPVFRESNLGACQNFIATHNLAQGEYVCHCDGDDVWLPGKLQAQADFLDTNKDFSVTWTRCNFFDDHGGFFNGELVDYSMFKEGIVTFEDALRLGSVGIHSSIMYRADVRKTREFQGDIIDLYFTWEFLSQGKGMILNNVLAEYRVDSNGAISKSSGALLKSLYAKHASYFFELFPMQRRSVFLFSLFNLLVDVKNRRSSSIRFFLLTIRSFSLVSPRTFFLHIQDAKKLSIPSLNYKE